MYIAFSILSCNTYMKQYAVHTKNNLIFSIILRLVAVCVDINVAKAISKMDTESAGGCRLVEM